MRRLSVLLALPLLVAGCGSDGRPATDGLFGRGTAVISTDPGEVRLDVEIARTDRARARGLMGRTELGEDEGMAFLFEEPRELSFWMKDTLIPLSIAFWDQDGRIVSIHELRPCRADPCPLTRSGAPAVGALEAKAGFFADNRVEVGDRVLVTEEGT